MPSSILAIALHDRRAQRGGRPNGSDPMNAYCQSETVGIEKHAAEYAKHTSSQNGTQTQQFDASALDVTLGWYDVVYIS